MIIKTLGLSQLIYSASNLVAPAGIEDTVKTKCFKFLWKNKKDKIKRSGLYQDTSKGGLRMTNIGLMLKSLNLAWIARLLAWPQARGVGAQFQTFSSEKWEV